MDEERAEDVEKAMGEWQRQHPKATFTEIERALDERLYEVRAKLLEGLVKEREASLRRGVERCPECGSKLRDAGKRKRQITTTGDQSIAMERRYLTCPECGAGLFPSSGRTGIFGVDVTR